MSLQILLADENLAVQKLVELTLGNEGMEVTSADNSLSALDLALKKTPDLILADFNIEGLDIFSFVKKVRQKERLADVPIILLINAAETFDPAQLQSAGVQAFFRKPIDSQTLLEEIKKLTGSAVQVPGSLGSISENEHSEISQHFTESEGEGRKMEELLGWSSPGDLNQESLSPSFEEQTIMSPSEPAEESVQGTAEESIPLPAPSEDQPEAASHQEDVKPLDRGEASESDAPSFLPDQPAETEPTSQPDIDSAIRQEVRASVEKVTWDVLPELLRSALSKDVMVPILEKVAWEVVAPIAETEIKKEIERLQTTKE